MKSFVFSAETGNRFFSISSQNILTSLLLLIFAWQQMARGQTDDFNDGNDTGWVRFGLDSAGLPPASYSFPDYDGFNGQAYRIFVSAPPIPDAGPARAFSYRTNQYDNFYLAVDVVTWDNTLNQAFGFLIRASNIGLGQTDGYVMNYDPNQQTGGRGQFQINRVDREAPADPLSGSATANITLDPTHRYRFVLTGAGSTLTGHIYDFLDLTTPLVTILADDAELPVGQPVGGLDRRDVRDPARQHHAVDEEDRRHGRAGAHGVGLDRLKPTARLGRWIVPARRSDPPGPGTRVRGAFSAPVGHDGGASSPRWM